MNYREYTKKLNNLQNKIYKMLLLKHTQGASSDEILEEDKELCLLLSSEIMKKLINGLSEKEIRNLLLSNYTIYEYFTFIADVSWVNLHIKKIMDFQKLAIKYFKLSKNEKKYFISEIDRLENLEKKLEEYYNHSSK